VDEPFRTSLVVSIPRCASCERRQQAVSTPIYTQGQWEGGCKCVSRGRWRTWGPQKVERRGAPGVVADGRMRLRRQQRHRPRLLKGWGQLDYAGDWGRGRASPRKCLLPANAGGCFVIHANSAAESTLLINGGISRGCWSSREEGDNGKNDQPEEPL
jgi:hypothetical protein